MKINELKKSLKEGDYDEILQEILIEKIKKDLKIIQEKANLNIVDLIKDEINDIIIDEIMEENIDLLNTFPTTIEVTKKVIKNEIEEISKEIGSTIHEEFAAELLMDYSKLLKKLIFWG